MIYSFKIKNYASIAGEQQISFVTNLKQDNSSVETKFGIVNKINCIVGNNASGKTNILKAISFFTWFAEDSFHDLKENSKIPIDIHRLHENEPCELEMEFSKNKNLFKLQIVVDDQHLLYEKLSIKTGANAKFKRVYSLKRTKTSTKTLYSEFLKPLNRTERERVVSKTNCSVFSYLTTTGLLKEIGLKSLFASSFSNTTYRGFESHPDILMCIDITRKISMQTDECIKKLSEVLKSLDIGITGVSKEKLAKVSINTGKEVSEEDLVCFVHGEGKNQFVLPIVEQSTGTIQSLAFILECLDILKTGGVMFIDEVEQSKHPNIIMPIITHFANNEINTENAQIIFSTHQPLLLEKRNKSQIFIVEKNDGLNTEVYRLDEVKGVRNDDNFSLKYLSGKYGGIPRRRVKIG